LTPLHLRAAGLAAESGYPKSARSARPRVAGLMVYEVTRLGGVPPGGQRREGCLPEKIAGLAALGATELVYQPAGSDIERELRAFPSAAGLAG
jgi:5,10-methylenetetrahydromethanopterin reductase